MTNFCSCRGRKRGIALSALWETIVLAGVIVLVCGVNKVELEVRQERVMKSQILSFSQMEITNFYNYQYYCKISLGSPPQKAEVILDTGSHHLWVPARNCTNCPITVRKFDPNKSSTALLLNEREELKYGKGQIKGYYIEDLLSFEQSNLTFQLILADYQKDTEHSQADGIMGLSNYKKLNNIFEVLQKKGIIASSSFAFELGLKELRQKSYFYYNLSKEEFGDAVYIKASRKDYWTIPIREIRADGKNFTIKHALVDSGTSLILMPPYLYLQFDKQIFSRYCDPFKVGDIRRCKCPSEVTYPNITIFSGDLSFNITPTAYVLGSFNNRVCMLGIDSLPDPLIDLLILGDLFFHQRLVIFDKENNQIGFVSNHKLVNLFPNSPWVLITLNILALLSLVVVVFVLGLRKTQNAGGMLREPLRIGAALEMTAA